MTQRNPIAVALLPFVTFGIYGIVWQVKTKNELNSLGAQIPTAWLLIVPFVSYYWLWKYSEAVEKTTNGSITAVLAFVLQLLLGSIGAAILQNEFNKPLGAAAGSAPAPNNGPQPDASFGGPVTMIAPVAPGSMPAPGVPMPIAAPAAPIEPTYAQPPQQQ